MSSSLAPPTQPQPNSTSPLPSPSATAGRKSSRFYLPLSNHGMPKTPSSLSPGSSVGSHRFSGPKSSASPVMAPTPDTPMSSAPPMSPPMSAKSFGTFIDSEPSTPAYSPRVGGDRWDNSTLVLLSPVSHSPSDKSDPSPVEPRWSMLTPKKMKRKTKRITPIMTGKPASSLTKAVSDTHKSTSGPVAKELSMDTSLEPHPIKPIQEEEQKENTPPRSSAEEKKANKEQEKSGEVKEDQEKKGEEEANEQGMQVTAPFEKLATRVKGMIKRKSTERSERRKREYQDLRRVETLHWTEM